VTEEELKQAFESQKDVLLAWGLMVRDAIASDLEKALAPDRKLAEFLKVPTEPRVKETESFLAKVFRRGKTYERPLEQITDKVGVRFVALLRSELKIIENIIEASSNWEAEKARDFEAEQFERPQHFDYQSIHYIVRAKRPVTAGALTIPARIPCEVQVRTLLQHAYAELSHNTTYKPLVTLERDVSRQIARASALVETTDEIFDLVGQQVEQANARIRQIHDVAREAYARILGSPGTEDIRLSYALFDRYRAQLAEITTDLLRIFLEQEDYIAGRVRERASQSVLYRHPSVLVVYFLVANEPDLVPKHWPFDLKHLEMIYADLGFSTEGRL
jgi:putative GTP pyrophosphokinase